MTCCEAPGEVDVQDRGRCFVLNALSVDVEDYYQVSAFAKTVQVEKWAGYESRVARNCERILAILAQHRLNATFFFLGWVAERHPALVQRIYTAGHEIATHGYAHQLIATQTPEEFRQDVARSVQVLEAITGERVLGYRAPSFSITPVTGWALDILSDLGLSYDSSVFPIHHDFGGFPDAPRHPYLVKEDLWEFPPATWRAWRWNVPIAGGGYLRLYPYRFTRWAIGRANRQGLPVMVYVHPWEFDPHQPRIEGASLLSRFRHYQNLGRTERRFGLLCADFRFAPVREALDGWISQHSDD